MSGQLDITAGYSQGLRAREDRGARRAAPSGFPLAAKFALQKRIRMNYPEGHGNAPYWAVFMDISLRPSNWID